MGDMDRKRVLKLKYEEKISELEAEMNRTFARMENLDNDQQDKELEFEDIPQSEGDAANAEHFPTEEENTPMEDEADLFLGANPEIAALAEIEIKEDLSARIKSWLAKGLASKEEKEKLLKIIPRKGNVNLEAPLLNDEILVDTNPKALTRDDFFKDYQNLTGSALSAVATVLDMIFKDAEDPLERDVILSNLSNAVKLLSHLFFSLNQARKSFIMGKYEDKIQKILKKVKSTSLLFGDNLKAVIESSKAMEKVSRDLKPKVKTSGKPNSSLNWKSSPVTREAKQNETILVEEDVHSIPTTTESPLATNEVSSAARLRYFEINWKSIIEDRFILEVVRGYKIDLIDKVTQKIQPTHLEPNNDLDLAINNLLDIKAIEKCSPEKGQLDLKDAYLTVPVDSNDKKYLRFNYRNQLYQFNSLPFGLSSAPFVFTKLGKPVVNWLRERGVKVVIYLDDLLIFGTSEEECAKNVSLAIEILEFLGFIINWKKSDLVPKHCCQFLGMIINSQQTTLALPEIKRLKIKNMLDKILRDKKIKIQKLSECIGVLVAACPAIAYGWLFYKHLEMTKISALRFNKNPNVEISLSDDAIKELVWWRSQILTATNKIRSSSFDLEIFSDASTTGWGATCGDKKASGFWNSSERNFQINLLELKAAFLALKCFAKNEFNKQILLRIDNLTALAYINKMEGTRHMHLNYVAKQIWEWCRSRELWIFAEYVASKDNKADEGSRITNVDTEWELADFAFRKICNNFGNPSIDLFASRINSKCKKYCSWDRDPEAYAINAMTVNWKNVFWYAFPPFSLITKVLKKVRDECSLGILVVPYWPKTSASLITEPYPGFWNCLRQTWHEKGLQEDTIEVMIASITESTAKQYNSVLKHWWAFCQQKEVNPFKAKEETILQCLTIRFSEGIFKLRPPNPRYQSTWDVNVVLDKLEEWIPLESLDLRKLTLKIVMLLALGSAYRVQNLSLIKLENIKFTNLGVEIRITDQIKTSRPGKSHPQVFFPFFIERPNICVARTLQEYLRRTEKIPGRPNNLFISFREPFKKVGSQTISRWLKLLMKEAGIQDEFKGHSTRHASTSKAWSRGLDINIIKEAAGWTQASTTFAKFYKRPIKNSKNEFAEMIFN
ncbi:uncharacterized protein LOC122505029 [Leptopilina heterotoma]|uniref:uncharacterized protein LOC122505029 n=1 Tax=Leptopilina heterotoma TaxID=63436 RepID=UPI001CA8FFE3|nr:uncharacterized protein LOC122505029 [Leptopilina heterotoma]